MDDLTSTTIDISEVPKASAKAVRVMGRTGRLWERLRQLPANKAEKVANRDRRHAMATMRTIRDHARKAKRGAEFQWTIDEESFVYFWWAKPSA